MGLDEIAIAALLHAAGILEVRAGEGGDPRDVGAAALEGFVSGGLPALVIEAIRVSGADRADAAGKDPETLAVALGSRVAGGGADPRAGEVYVPLAAEAVLAGRELEAAPEERWLRPVPPESDDPDRPVAARHVFLASPVYRDLASLLRGDLAALCADAAAPLRVDDVLRVVLARFGRVPAGVEGRPSLSLADHALAAAAVAPALAAGEVPLTAESDPWQARRLALWAVRVDGLRIVAERGHHALHRVVRAVRRCAGGAASRLGLPVTTRIHVAADGFLFLLPASAAFEERARALAAGLRGYLVGRFRGGVHLAEVWWPVSPATLAGEEGHPWVELEARLRASGPAVPAGAFQPREVRVPRRSGSARELARRGAVLAFGVGAGGLALGPADLARWAGLRRTLGRLQDALFREHGGEGVCLTDGFLVAGPAADLGRWACKAAERVRVRTGENPALLPAAALVPGGSGAVEAAYVWLAAERVAGGDHLAVVDPAPVSGSPAAVRIGWDRVEASFLSPLEAVGGLLSVTPRIHRAAVVTHLLAPALSRGRLAAAVARAEVVRRGGAGDWATVAEQLFGVGAPRGPALAIRWHLAGDLPVAGMKTRGGS